MAKNHKIHIATEEYCFVEADVEGTPSEVAGYYVELKDALTGGEGLNQLQWSKVRNHYSKTGELEVEDHERCNKLQRYVLGQMKKAHKTTVIEDETFNEHLQSIKN